MLYQNYQVGVCQAVFDVRQNPKVTASFENIYGTKRLTSSIDGVAFGLDPQKTSRGWDGKPWLHLDQAVKKDGSRSGFECVQSWVTAEDVGEEMQTLHLYLSEAIYFIENFQEFGTTTSNHELVYAQGPSYRLVQTSNVPSTMSRVQQDHRSFGTHAPCTLEEHR